MPGRLPIDYREHLDTIAALPGSWYASQEIPDMLIRSLRESPLVDEWDIDRTRYDGPGRRVVSRPMAEVLACAANGMNREETARHLHKSPHTIEWHRKQAFKRLGAKNTTQAVATAILLGLLTCSVGASAAPAPTG